MNPSVCVKHINFLFFAVFKQTYVLKLIISHPMIQTRARFVLSKNSIEYVMYGRWHTIAVMKQEARTFRFCINVFIFNSAFATAILLSERGTMLSQALNSAYAEGYFAFAVRRLYPN